MSSLADCAPTPSTRAGEWGPDHKEAVPDIVIHDVFPALLGGISIIEVAIFSFCLNFFPLGF